MGEGAAVGGVGGVGGGQSDLFGGLLVPWLGGGVAVRGRVVADLLLDLDGLREEVFVKQLQGGVAGLFGIDCLLLLGDHVEHAGR
jgi:hypothetical protein